MGRGREAVGAWVGRKMVRKSVVQGLKAPRAYAQGGLGGHPVPDQNVGGRDTSLPPWGLPVKLPVSEQ